MRQGTPCLITSPLLWSHYLINKSSMQILQLKIIFANRQIGVHFGRFYLSINCYVFISKAKVSYHLVKFQNFRKFENQQNLADDHCIESKFNFQNYGNIYETQIAMNQEIKHALVAMMWSPYNTRYGRGHRVTSLYWRAFYLPIPICWRKSVSSGKEVTNYGS